ncbi:Glucose/ribitol dehydrogenase [Penicillium atrosanguineum]|uniref:Glucose/ribitol dehydrogenase n=1 Tax=Penicillium atrosanguineum TaxID=1132637 RepID=A0A9W9QD28_9EURO|nr:AMP-dependent synthetase/ligase [Penicillium atrosanguineum]KAJ5127076.1 Glucose/ribitol dehydrogenase [Penicillium atrosanguineum]KAJ5314240.1 AMP-dependent synthetase/ligase [Penicillium atrosanguineum]KAJ5331407.1 Glucose/ribitol dehydrogenase [Penicillium atrosanguineum]
MGANLESSTCDLSGKVAIVTGGHTGLGFGTSVELAKRGARVYIASRSASKTEESKNEIRQEFPAADVHFLPLDLADLDSVRQAAEKFAQHESALHILVNNAGVMCVPYEETKDGSEMQLAVNYLGHFLLTKLLLPTLLNTTESVPEGTVRIVNVSSDGHAKLAPKQGIIFSDMNMKKDFSVWARYGHSKLANVLHAKELATRYSKIMSLSLHPGTVKTGLSQGPLSSTPLYRFIKPLVELGAPGPREGARSIIYAATSTSLTIERDNGAYILPIGKVAVASQAARDPKMAHDLWDWTERKTESLEH